MDIVRRLCLFVDHDLSKTGKVQSGARSLFIAMSIGCSPLLLVSRPYNKTEIVLIIVAISISIFWIAFVFWRGWRLFKAITLRVDRSFDRVEKFKLADEYHSSKSATAKARRKLSDGN